MNKYVALIVFPLPGLILTVFSGVFGWVLFPSIIQSEIQKQTRLVEGSDTWNKWKEAPIPIYLSFYIFHITNPDEVERGLKPVFQEKGPFSYRQQRYKVDLRQDNGKDTVKYKDLIVYHFDAEHSQNNSENELVNIPNIPFIAVIHTITKTIPLDLVAGLVGNLILNEEQLIRRNVPVKELLFQGFDVTRYTNSLLGKQLPKEFSGGRFGLYKGKNGTASQEWEVYTGVGNPKDFGRVKTWDGKEYLGYWKPLSQCDKVSGTDGSVFPPFITRETKMEAFSSELCRSLPMVYHRDTEFKGIPGFRFGADKDTFADVRVNPKNRCFCLEENIDNCPRSGVLPLEPCMKAPIWSSGPYFMGADPSYQEEAGLPPADFEKHTTFIDLEPTTGLMLQAHKRLQINLEVSYNRKVRALQHLTKDKMLYPLIWADESAQLDDKLAGQLKSMLFTPVKIVGIAKWVGLALGLLLLTLGIGLYVQRYVLQNPLRKDKVRLDLARQSAKSSRRSSGSRRRVSAEMTENIVSTDTSSTSTSSAASI